jgi:hypothetical protein
MNWIKGTSGTDQEIKLSLSSPFFEEGVIPASGANVTVADTNGNIFDFTEVGTTGIYRTTAFIASIGETYQLRVSYENEVYTAEETLLSVAPIDFIEQENDGGLSGDEIEIKAFYTDPAGKVITIFLNFFQTLLQFQIWRYMKTALQMAIKSLDSIQAKILSQVMNLELEFTEYLRGFMTSCLFYYNKDLKVRVDRLKRNPQP